jgi:hypothetical protein
MKKAALIMVLVVLVGAWIVLFRPHESLERVRAGDEPIDVKAEYVNVTGSGGCTKLYQLDKDGKVDYSQPIFPATTGSIPSPDAGDYAYAGNVFRLQGYPYVFVRRNRITGETTTWRSPRLDIIKWTLKSPYTVWIGEDKEGVTATEQRTEPLEFRLNSDNHQPRQFTMENYIDCLADNDMR